MEIINHITVKEIDKIKEFHKKFKSKLEDIFFIFIGRLPQKFIPSWAMEWLDKYIDKRVIELQIEQTQVNWKKSHMEKVLEELKCK